MENNDCKVPTPVDEDVMVGDVLVNGLSAIQKYNLDALIPAFLAKGPEWGDKLLKIAETNSKLYLDIQVRMAKSIYEILSSNSVESKIVLDEINEQNKTLRKFIEEKGDDMTEDDRKFYQDLLQENIEKMISFVESNKRFKKEMAGIQYSTSKDVLNKKKSSIDAYLPSFGIGTGIGFFAGLIYAVYKGNRRR